MTHSLRSILLATAAAAVLCAPAAAQTAPRVISFGDSLSDTGNLFGVSGNPPAPYFQGRFSNGPVFTEILAGGVNSMQPAGALSAAGRPVDPNRSQNYAFGGARTDATPFAGAQTPPGVPLQLGAFLRQGQ